MEAVHVVELERSKKIKARVENICKVLKWIAISIGILLGISIIWVMFTLNFVATAVILVVSGSITGLVLMENLYSKANKTIDRASVWGTVDD